VWIILSAGLFLLEGLIKLITKALPASSNSNLAGEVLEFGVDTASYAADKGLSMAIYLMLPSIVWSDLDVFKAINKGFSALNTISTEFVLDIFEVMFIGLFLSLPVVVLLFLGHNYKGHIAPFHFSTNFWLGSLAYEVLIGSMMTYFQQLFIAQLYLWYLKWEKKADEAIKANAPYPRIREIEPPILLQDFRSCDI
jgi:hypothetical protein